MLAVLWLACADETPTDSDSASPPTPTDTATSTPDTDSPTTTIPTTQVPTFSAVTTRLHDRYGTLAYVGWTQDGAAPVHVEYRIAGEEWRSSPTKDREAGTFEQILLGLPYDVDVDWEIRVAQNVVGSGTVHTENAPVLMPTPSIDVSDPTRWYADGAYLLTSTGSEPDGWGGAPWWVEILDRQGRVVWARRDLDWTLFATVSPSTGADLLLDLDTTWSDSDGGLGSQVLRTKLDREVERYDTPGLQHPFVELPDGTLAWASIQHDPTEAIVELPPGETDPIVIWTCGDDWPEGSDCESNGLYYDAATNSYLYSSWTNFSVVSVDRSSGSTLWYAGNVGGGYDFVPSDSQFILQHGVSWTDAGTFLVSSERYGPTTVVYEYEVDEAAEELQLVWSYDADVYARYNGDAWRLPNGNTLHVVGNTGIVNEVAPDGDVVWQADWHEDLLLGRGEWIADLYTLVDP